MPKTRLMLCMLMLCLMWTTSFSYGADEPKFKIPTKEVIQEWESAGLKMVKIGIHKDHPFNLTAFEPVETLINPIPCFYDRELKKGLTIGSLPDPKVPFALSKHRGDPEEFFKGINTHENLRVLVLPRRELDDKKTELISGIRNLEYLDLGGARITDSGMSELTKLAKLKYLNLNDVDLSDKGVFQLGAFEELETLSLNRGPLAENKITGAGLQGLSKLKKLKHLSLWNNKISDVDLAALKDLTQLESLNLNGTKVTFGGIKQLLDMKSMKRLELSQIALAPEDLKQIVTGMPKLEYLGLSHKNINDECIVEIAKLKNLKYLYLGESSVSEHGLKPFYASETLETLQLYPSRSPEFLNHIGALKSIKRLYLQGAEVTDKEVAEVSKLPKLEYLWIAYSKVTDKGLEELHKVKTLKEIDIEQTPTTIEGIKVLQKALPGCKIRKRDLILD